MLSLLLACRDPAQPPLQPVPAPVEPETADTGEPPVVEPPGVPLVVFDGEPPKNLIVISLDTTRRDFVGRHGGTDSTPNLDRVLAEGVVLEDHRSCSNWTGASMACVVTGNLPIEQGWWPRLPGSPIGDPLIPPQIDDLPTLASQLDAQGWLTTVVTGNEVFGWDLNLDNGFQQFFNPEFRPADVVARVGIREAEDLVDQTLPYYLHVHFIDPHGTYCPPDGYLDEEDYVDLGYDLCPDAEDLVIDPFPSQTPDWQHQFVVDLQELYDAELEYWDAEFGLFWDELEGMGSLDDALVVFVTDHGEQLLERGELGHGHGLGSEENRAVAAFWAKNLAPAAWDGPTVHQDIAATLQDLYGIVPPFPTSGAIVGTAPRDRVIRGMNYWADVGPQLSIVQNDLQLTYDWSGDRALYRLAADPAGLADRYDPSDADTQAAWVPMTAFVDEVAATWEHLDSPAAPGP